jgi:purine-binding chemotaxis protein CheW
MSDSTTSTWVVARVGDAEYAIDIGTVQEVIRMDAELQAPPAVGGTPRVIDLRGRAVAVNQLELLLSPSTRTGAAASNVVTLRAAAAPLDASVAAHARVVIIALGDTWHGLMVDEVEEVVTCPQEQLHPAPPAAARAISAVANMDGRIVFVLDPEILMRDAAAPNGREGDAVVAA